MQRADALLPDNRMPQVQSLSEEAVSSAFDAFRQALQKARLVGNIRTMRAAVEAYDRFEDVVVCSQCPTTDTSPK
jgi:hypothetical protein